MPRLDEPSKKQAHGRFVARDFLRSAMPINLCHTMPYRNCSRFKNYGIVSTNGGLEWLGLQPLCQRGLILPEALSLEVQDPHL